MDLSNQLDRTIAMLKVELDDRLDVLGAAGVGNTSPPVGLGVPSPTSFPTGGEQTMGARKHVKAKRFQKPNKSTPVIARVPTVKYSCADCVDNGVVYPSNPKLPFVKTNKPIEQPDNFDGSIPLDDWLTNFNLCSQINSWKEDQRIRFLAVRLRGPALQVYTDLPVYHKYDFEMIVNALRDRFCPKGQTDLHRAQLRSRIRKKNETLSELASSIRRLTVKAYPDVPTEFREELARDQFIEALDSPDVRMQVRRDRPKTLCNALSLALEEEAFIHLECNKVERSKQLVASAQLSTIDLEQKIDQIECSLKELKLVVDSKFAQQSRGPIVCWGCHQQGHIRSKCPNKMVTITGTETYNAESNLNGKGLNRGPMFGHR